MLRINQIIKILGGMKAYAPYTYKSKTDKLVDKIHGRLVRFGIFIIALLALSIALYKFNSCFKTDTVVDVIFGLYFIGMLIGLIIMVLPPILGIKHLVDWKKESFNDFVCEISHDEENAKLLLDYSEKELLYAVHWIQLKINRITMRVSSFFGEKTAVFSVLGLCYSAVQALIGFDKLSKTFIGDLSNADSTNTVIMFGLALLLGISLGALMLKKVASHQLYLKEIVELTIRIKKDVEDEGGI
ncbi:hypothetical protein ACI5OG_001527 [Salmonella enterica subsp. enterica serovar Derby]|uniref:Uncharacterized protein n=6 Tax=Salmonella enterica TaxID=28901 RepID=A0A5Z7EMB2_SALER|nr:MULTISPECIES: hypothetical protein [Salmonella]EBE3860273.1 hypothetical protein [Salmonella enterica subsp. enterica serovar Agona]EBP4035335.1 hypothetical protein [Salmonella enterica subsp. salamae]EBW8714606.1 hypothetical protein [Salmonella enterica subsp. enterica serovar Oranienburg]EDS5963236.1 hypothetical protein [Salmonella enterica subsp. enterica serovar Berta]EDU6161070.1 hypothetical protein [Salmonella enterica subsp. enterica serovar Derby str. CFSAN000564]EDW8047352.1 h